ncbi:MAG: glycosyltransferase family 2 protein [Bacteroidales bacterium]
MSKTSVVILNWNGEKVLQQFLPLVFANTLDSNTEIVVADNGSTDASVSYVTKNFPQVRLLKFDKNYGFAGGYNRVIASIKSTYTVLLNSDVELTPYWLTPLVDYLDKNESVGAVMPKILSFDNKESFEYAGAAGGFIDILGYPFCRGRVLGKIEKDSGQYDDTKQIFWATGACMLVRTELFKRLGGLDERFFVHMEEIDLCWRMQNAGFSIVYVGKSKVFHIGGGTLPNNNPKKLFYNYRNNLLMLHKNLPSNLHLPILFIRLLLDGLSALVFILQLKIDYTIAIVKAHIDFWKLQKGMRSQKNLSKIKDLSGVYKNSIIVNYFIFGKRTFDEIFNKTNG